jgi:hypothetical protein
MLDQPVRAQRNKIKYAKYSVEQIYDLEYMIEKQREE